MTIAELIRQLQDLAEEHGDWLPVYSEGWPVDYAYLEAEYDSQQNPVAYYIVLENKH